LSDGKSRKNATNLQLSMILKRRPDIMKDPRDALAVTQWCDKEHPRDDSVEWYDARRDLPGNYRGVDLYYWRLPCRSLVCDQSQLREATVTRVSAPASLPPCG